MAWCPLEPGPGGPGPGGRRRPLHLLHLLHLLLHLLSVRAEECSLGFSVVAPEVGVPGRATAVLVTLHGAADDAPPRNVTVRLLGPSGAFGSSQSSLLVQTTQEIRGRGIVPVQVPSDATGLCDLQTQVECVAPAPSATPGAAPSSQCPQVTMTELRLLPPVRDIIVRADRSTALPGDSVTFWVLALNHDMKLPAEATASVSVKDSFGTKVAVWEEVALDQGVQQFEFTLSPGATLGRWRLEVTVDGLSFGSDLSVSLAGPDESWSWGWGWSWPHAVPEGSATPEVAMAEEHFVELHFGNGMRRVYKPGMPFIGKVEAVSSERSVRVRIKLYDNTTAIYSQDVEISSGEATFVVPAILADSSCITMQAELVSVEGKEIESHYVLAREHIYRWNSTSQCFLLVQGLEKTMQVDEVAEVRVLSTCPCRSDLHYVVTTQGHVAHWSQLTGLTGSAEPVETLDAGGVACVTNFTFPVQSLMAPVSRLLVYYVSADGEPVSDVVTFDVQLVDKHMSISFEQKPSWSPGENMDVEILAENEALVCLVGGRLPNSGRGRPGAAVDLQDAVPPGPLGASRAVDFLDAGLSLYERPCSASGRTASHRHGSTEDLRIRDALSGLRCLQLQQLWLWKCFNYTSRVAAEGVTLRVPEGAGQWTLWGLSLSPSAGLRLTTPATITVFRPLGVDFRLPRSLRIGEVLEVGVKIANNLNSCVDVSALLSLKEGAHFQSSGLGFVSERLRLGPHGATSLVVRIQATTQSTNNLTAEVIAHAAASCQAPASYASEAEATARVQRSATFMVLPEGLTRTRTESAYFCANEHIMISTSENFRFDFIPAPRNREAVVLEVRAGQGARIALSDRPASTDWMYQIVIGDSDNTVTWIGRGKHEYSVHLASAQTPSILSAARDRTFWVSWDRGTLRFGLGAVIGTDVLLKWRHSKKVKVQYLGFASSWGKTADFRIWNFNDESGFSQVLHLDIPRSVVPGSERGALLVAGGMALPGAGVRLEEGSGLGGIGSIQDTELPEEAEVVFRGPQHPLDSSLAAAVSAFAPLPGLRLLPPQSEYLQQVLSSLRIRLQELFAFLRPDGSFGDHRSHGSHRSTVTILDLLTEAQSYFSVDAELVVAAKRWVLGRQQEDGGFVPPTADLRDGAEDAAQLSRGAIGAPTATSATPQQQPDNRTAADVLLESRIETTAETLATLLGVGVESERDSEAVLRARYFLESHVFAARDPVALAALCYALVLAHSDVAGAALARLRAASTNQEGDFSWPAPTSPVQGPDWLTEEGDNSRYREPLHLNVREFRASLYVLLTRCLLKDLSAAEPVARYLFYRAHLLDVHPELAYLSVKAFAAFGQLARDEHRALTVSLATSGMELTDTIELRPGTSPSSLPLPSLPTRVFVYATGAGCATVQGLIQYSTYLPKNKTPLLDLWAGVEGEVPPPRNSLEELEGKQPILRLKTCFRWKGLQPSGVLRLDVTLFSGFELLTMTPIALDDAHLERDVHYGSRGDHVWVVMSNVTSRCSVCIHFAVRSSFVISGIRPAFVRVYPASRSDMAAETFFHSHRGSSLLAGITEDDIVTWFGRPEDAGETQLSSDFKGLCECGKSCSSPHANATGDPRTRSDSFGSSMPGVTSASSTSRAAPSAPPVVTASTPPPTSSDTGTTSSSPSAPAASKPRNADTTSSPALPSTSAPPVATTTVSASTASVTTATSPSIPMLPTSTTSTPRTSMTTPITPETSTSQATTVEPPITSTSPHPTPRLIPNSPSPSPSQTNTLPELHYEINNPQAPEATSVAVELKLLPELKPSTAAISTSTLSPSSSQHPDSSSMKPTSTASIQTEHDGHMSNDISDDPVEPLLKSKRISVEAAPVEMIVKDFGSKDFVPASTGEPVSSGVVTSSTVGVTTGGPSSRPLRKPVIEQLIIVRQDPPVGFTPPTDPPELPAHRRPSTTPVPAETLRQLSPEQRRFYEAQRRMDDATRQARMESLRHLFDAGAAAINTARGPLQPILSPSPSPPRATPSRPGLGLAAAEHNPLWGLLREVVGPEDVNKQDAEVVGTISEETKDEEQQDEDEEKLTFD